MPQLIVIVAAFLLVWLQWRIYKSRWRNGLDMSLGFSVHSATEGDIISVAEVLENAKLLPLPWVDVKFQISGDLVFEGCHNTGADSTRSELFSIGPYKRITRTHKILCSRRGHYTVKSMSVSVRDLLLGGKYVAQFSCGQSLTVYPAPVPYDSFMPAFRCITGIVRTRRFINPDPFEFRGIRSYEPGDSMRSVNHRATAKTGELMVNTFAPTSSQQVMIWLNTEPYSAYALPEIYEMSIRLAATLSEQLIAEGLTVSLKTGAMNTLSPGECISVPGGAGKEHLLCILEALALIDMTQKPEPIHHLIEQSADDCVHIIISPCDSEDVEHAVNVLECSGRDAVWILPRKHSTRMRVAESSSRFYWEIL